MASFFEQFILGMIQGIVEWIPFSSEGVLLFVKTTFFSETSVKDLVRQALLLHLGTFFAALIYFWKDIKILVHGLFNGDKADLETRKTLRFIGLSTIVTGIIGLAFYGIIYFLDAKFVFTTRILAFVVGALLIVNGTMQLRASGRGIKTIFHIKDSDSLFTGFMQGLASLPGLSRSGLTVSAMLFRRINETTALRLSFLMSLPVVLFANILLNLGDVTFVWNMIWGLIFSFIFGYATIHLLMKLSEKIRFGWFVIIIAIFMILSGIFFHGTLPVST